ncbi:MAG: tRNA (guanosine(37)-N1)-methyltransferase TrmD [Candidatus Shapirobacteria bacterium]|nr:tRNA (guanosine(37)-N1)-methyltransferase TrmD [Candidatus Shapirobacteria bacterium]
MKIDILTLFPKMFESPFEESIVARAVKNKIIELNIHNLRDWAIDSYGSVDDKPFGGGVGMLIKPEPVYKALDDIFNFQFSIFNNNEDKRPKRDIAKTRVIMMSARGKRFDQKKAEELSKLENLVLVAGHYEGFDQRVSDYMVDEEISIGNYVLTGGEIPSMVIIDSVVRLLPGVLGKDNSSEIESFSEQEIGGKIVRTIEYPQYTRPQNFLGMKVPEVLISGDPKKIKEWQMEQTKKYLK